MSVESHWLQRFQNFEKAFLFFENTIEQGNYTLLEFAVLVQSFEFTFLLALKALKDYLDEQGLSVNFPKEIIKTAFKFKLIEDGHTWLYILEKRNELTNTYNQEVADDAVAIICYRYFHAIAQAYNKLKTIFNNAR